MCLSQGISVAWSKHHCHLLPQSERQNNKQMILAVDDLVAFGGCHNATTVRAVRSVNYQRIYNKILKRLHLLRDFKLAQPQGRVLFPCWFAGGHQTTCDKSPRRSHATLNHWIASWLVPGRTLVERSSSETRDLSSLMYRRTSHFHRPPSSRRRFKFDVEFAGRLSHMPL